MTGSATAFGSRPTPSPSPPLMIFFTNGEKTPEVCCFPRGDNIGPLGPCRSGDTREGSGFSRQLSAELFECRLLAVDPRLGTLPNIRKKSIGDRDLNSLFSGEAKEVRERDLARA
jgi:hypothetical protein